jgi:probable phosphoglycerate mutase
MILYCVRHAESIFNSQGRIQGQADPPLSDEGWRQAHALAAAFCQRNDPHVHNGVPFVPLDGIFSSPLRRALETAHCIAQAVRLRVETDDRLKELNAGIFQGRLWSEISDLYPDEAARWKSRDPDYVIPQGESRRALMLRGAEALAAIRRSGKRRVVVVAHGGLLTAALKQLLGVPPRLSPFSLFNASISQLDWSDEHNLRVVTLNETEHLLRAGCATRGGDL